MGYLNGSVYLLEIDGTTLPDQTEGSISISMDVIDTSHKESGGYRTLMPGQRSASISVSGLCDDDGSGGAGATLFALIDDGSADAVRDDSVALVFGFAAASPATDEYTYSCNAILSSLEISAGTEDTVTYSATFEVTGAITQTTA